MEIESSWIPQIALAISAALVAFGLVISYRQPPKYGPGKITRGSDNPTVTTIARNDLIARRFFENQALVAKAKFWGLGNTGIALSLKGDPTEYLLTNDGDWYKETHFKVKPDIRLILLADGAPIVVAQRLPDALGGWKKDKDGKYTTAYDIDCAGGCFEFVRLKRAKFALRQGGTVLGIAAMPLPSGIFSRLKSRIELPASLSLATRLFLAMLVEIEDDDRVGSSSS